MLIPEHLQDLVAMPRCVLQHFKDGGFSVRLSNTDWHAVGLDECHEMMINKDAKMAVIRPNENKMEFVSDYLQFRSTCLKNLYDQLSSHDNSHTFTHKPTSRDKNADSNIQAMNTAITSHGMFYELPDNMGLWNFLDQIKATSEQEQHLLSIRHIGQTKYDLYIASKNLKSGQYQHPKSQKKKRLCSFSVSKAERRRVKQVDRERKLCQTYLKQQLKWVTQYGYDETNPDMMYGQISRYYHQSLRF